MKQILQDMSSGETKLIIAPAPNIRRGQCLIETKVSLISAGTERMLVGFGKGGLIAKAQQQPDKVKMVLAKAKTDGLLATIDAVKSKLGQPLPLGYCNVGTVVELGRGIDAFKMGDRVVSNGPHADVVCVAKNLCAKIPDNVDDESAAFTVLASIGLQGVRLVQPTLGETVVVIGVGLIGLCAVQLLRANGCKVLAIDFDQSKLDLAKQFGAQICNPSRGEDPISAGMNASSGNGVDAVIVTASTKSSDPISQAANMCRKRGRIILVGVTGLELSRAEFYEKELSFQVSCSYGPGRYDQEYEDKGNDYPLGFVRWTEQRNFEAILDLLSAGKLDFKPLISHRYMFDDAVKAYDELMEDRGALGILLQYSKEEAPGKFDKRFVLQDGIEYDEKKAVIGLVGAGNYASRVLIPAFKKGGAQLHSISTLGGINSVIHGGGFSNALSDTDAMLADQQINTVAIVTRHDSHAPLIVKAMAQGKDVFVEKPLAINHEQLAAIKESVAGLGETCPRLMVGFNRRFSPQVIKMKELLGSVSEPKSFVMTMNAGAIPADHWAQNTEVGGGRIIGEACHFIDLMRFLAGSKITAWQALKMGESSAIGITEDNASITLGFEDGSFGTIHYLANGASSFPKERIEVFAAGATLQLDNFRKLKGFGWKRFTKMNLWRQDKGQEACVAAFLGAIEFGRPSPIAIDELIEVAEVTINVAEILRKQ